MIKKVKQKSLPPAKVFISATSGDLRTVRELVKEGLLTMGCMPVEQENFPPDYRSVREMLEDKITQCDAVIHIVGMRYGAEPNPTTLPEGTPRRSYTQMEADIARRLGKKLYIFVCKENFPFADPPEPEPEEKKALQAKYRNEIMSREELYTYVKSPEDVARKVRELQIEIESLRRTIHHERRYHAFVLLGLIIVLVAIGVGIWWPRSVEYDREKIRIQVAKDIRVTAAKRIAELKDKGADWREVFEVENWQDQQLRELDRFLDGISEAFNEGEASKVFQKAQELLQNKGAKEALEYLEAKSEQRWKQIENLTASQKRKEVKKRKLLREELLKVSILETQFRFEEAEAAYQKVISAAQDWAKPRNDFAWFLVRRGTLIDPNLGNKKIKEAVEIFRKTINSNPKDGTPQVWAHTQMLMGSALLQQAIRAEGEEGSKLLKEAGGALGKASEVFSRNEHPEQWAMIQRIDAQIFLEWASRSIWLERITLIELAIMSIKRALEIYTYEEHRLEWAKTQVTLGDALAQKGFKRKFADVKIASQAVEAYRNALYVFIHNKYPEQAAMIMLKIARTLSKLGERIEGEQGITLMEEAVGAYNLAFEVYSPEKHAQLWAMTQNNLGDTLAELGTRTAGDEGKKLLQAAAEAYIKALEIHTQKELPKKWAMTQNNLGQVFYELGRRTEGEDGINFLNEAIKAYTITLEVFTEKEFPKHWAKANINRGRAFQELGKRTTGEEGRIFLRTAAAVYNMALFMMTELPLKFNRLPKDLTKMYLVETYVQLKNWFNAAFYYSLLFEYSPNSKETLQAASILHKEVKYYSSLLKSSPDNEEAYHIAGFLYHEALFDFAMAFELRRNWVAAHPNDLSAQVELAENLFTTGNFEECEGRLSKLISNPSLDTNKKIALAFIEIANLIAQNRSKVVSSKLKYLRENISEQSENFRISWTFKGITHFLKMNENLATYRDLFVKLFQAAEGKNRDAILSSLEIVMKTIQPINKVL